MPASHSSGKPSKPHPDFPLGYHPSGYWCKKIRGKLHYFGPRFDPADPSAVRSAADAALAEYLGKKDALHSGKTSRPDPAELTVREAANHFLHAKRQRVDNGELSPRTWQGYKEACGLVINTFGPRRLAADLGPDDFAALRSKLATRFGPYRLGNTIQCVRCLFKHAYDAGLIDRPVRFGPGFKRPSKKTLRLHRAKQGPNLFTAGEILRLIGAPPWQPHASAAMRAMILLGINCGFGNADCGNLRFASVDLDAGVIDFPRPKTGIARRCPLWPETVSAVRAYLAERPEPRSAGDAGLVFVTTSGQSWDKDVADSPVSKEMAKLLRKLGITGRTFYTLRHTHRSVSDEARDQPAADLIMGHEAPHMSSHYRERISDERLRAVSDHVRDWLFG